MQREILEQLTTPENNLSFKLKRYLPGPQLDALLARPGLDTLVACTDHLDALLRAVATYLPRYLVDELLADPQPGQTGGRFREATIMFADISGFTAMSERLSLQGEKGAEKITNIVGDYFTAMLDITARQGGDLLKFGGDALLVAFLGDDDPVTVDHAVRACRAAAQMQQAIARYSEVEAFGETFRLKMTVSPGTTLFLNFTLSILRKKVRYFSGSSMVLSIRMPPVWAMASICNTPGITGSSGKWPTKKSSFMVTFFTPTTWFSSMSRILSMSRKGGLCGNTFLMPLISKSGSLFRSNGGLNLLFSFSTM